jgi:hypothetical protein
VRDQRRDERGERGEREQLGGKCANKTPKASGGDRAAESGEERGSSCEANAKTKPSMGQEV